MFCHLERLELRVDICPVKCMYRDSLGKCAFEKLSGESVDLLELAALKGEKSYKVKAQVASAKASISLGLVAYRYAEYVRDSFPDQASHVVNTGEGSHVNRVLHSVYRLSPDQQQQFWDEKRFTLWSERNNAEVSLADVKQALLSTVPVSNT